MTGAKASADKVQPLVKNDYTDSKPVGHEGGSGSDDAEAAEYPEMQIKSPQLLLSLPTVKKGVKKLSREHLTSVLSS